MAYPEKYMESDLCTPLFWHTRTVTEMTVALENSGASLELPLNLYLDVRVKDHQEQTIVR